MQTTPKANNILGHFFALLGAVVMLAIATWVSASSSHQVEPLDNLATARTGHAATALSDGRILITGGRDDAGHLVAASEIFDPETQISTASATLHTARVNHSATLLADGRVLVAGGTDASGPMSSAEIFDPAHPANGFMPVTSPMSTARTRHTATLLNDGHVLIAGGDVQGTAELFDPATGTFMPTIWPLTIARSGHTATLFTDDSVLLAGGNTATMETFVPNQGFTLDPASMSVGRTGHWAFELSDTRLLLFQGDTGNTIDEFNPGTGTITPKGSLDFHASSSSLLANGKVLVVGTDVSGLYDPDATPPAPDFTAFNEASVPNSGILARSGQSSTQLPGDKKILIAGGANAQNVFEGLPLFNPAKIWTDRDDYQPGDPVILSGSGWTANEDVYLYAVDNETQQWTYGSTETAGADGSFVDRPYFIVQQRMLGATFIVTAVGAQSNMQADVEFTDAAPANVNFATTGLPGGASVTVTYSGTNNGGNSISGSVTFSASGPSSGGNGVIGTQPTSQFSFAFPVSITVSGTTYNLNSASPTSPFTTGASGSTTTVTGTYAPATASTITTVASSSNPSVYGNPVTFTATVTRTSGSGTPTGTVNFTIAGIGLVAGTPGATTANTATWTATTAALTAGNHSVSASYVHTGAFQDSSGSLASGQTVNPAALTITATSVSKTYGDTYTPDTTPPSLDFTVTGLVGSDSVTSVTLNSAGYAPSAAVSGSPYIVTPSAAVGTGLGNYGITYNNGTITLTRKSASVTPNTASKTYGAADPALTGTLTGFLAADGVTATYSRTAGETVLGGPYTISATLSPAAVLGNYNITYNTANFTITAKSASVTPNAASKTYGAADPALTGTLTGFLAADGVTATYSRTAGETVLDGPYTISATLSPAAVLSNYSITYNTANFTIDAKSASVTPNAASKAYGAADPALTGTLTGFLAADGVTATYSRTAGETVLDGPYTISGTLSPAAVLSNYSITYNTANFTIDAKSASVTPDAKSKEYGALDPAFTGTLSGFLAGDGVTATYSRTAGETVLDGPYTISATLSPAAVLSNYNITYNTASFTITTRPASVTPNPATKVYGSTDPAFTGTLSGFLAGDGVTATYSRTTGETVLGSPYTISATLSPAGVLSNYSITYSTANFTITTKPASVTPNAATKVYGDADPAFTGTLIGFLAADGVTASYSRTAGENVVGSPYTISAMLSPSGVLSNYAITYNTAVFTITPKPASVTADNNSKTYGQANPSLTATVVGQVTGGDTINYSLSTSAAQCSNVGPYTITVTLGSNPNYTVTPNNGILTIIKKHLTVTADSRSSAYTGTPFTAFTATITGFACGDTVAVVSGSASFTPSPTSATLPGTYTITPAQGTLNATNYDFTPFVNGTLNIGFGNCAGGGVILQPINSDGTSVFPKAGRTVPVKFYVCDASGNHISDANVVFAGMGGQLTMLSQVRSQIQTVDEGTYNDVPDAAFRWSPGDNLWIWNMTTNNLQSGNKYTFHINLRNGAYIEFFIAIK